MRHYTYDDNIFEVIDTQEKAYWLGFLYADGWVSKNLDKFYLTISNKDEKHLEEYRDFICPDRPIERDDKRNSVRVSVVNKKITADLVKAGCTPQKSLTLKAPTEDMVPAHLSRHFIRGYFDGDGCARMLKNDTRVKIDFTGTESMLNYIADRFKNVGISFRSQPRKVKAYNAWRWECEATQTIKDIYNYMYWDSHTHLNRKRLILIRAFGLTKSN